MIHQSKYPKALADTEQRKLEPEEIDLWERVTQTFKTKNGRNNEGKILLSKGSAIKNDAVTNAKKTNFPQKLIDSEEPKSQQKLGKVPELDRKTKRRLSRGQVDIKRVLDLHGHTQKSAKKALIVFLAQAFNDQFREVLVITGKGGKQFGELGVLRQFVPIWLNEKPLRGLIQGFSYAAQAHGGEGALYLILRKKK